MKGRLIDFQGGVVAEYAHEGSVQNAHKYVVAGGKLFEYRSTQGQVLVFVQIEALAVDL